VSHARNQRNGTIPAAQACGRRLLHALRQDERAPIWNWPNGEQLDAAGLEQVNRFAQALQRNRADSGSAVQIGSPALSSSVLRGRACSIVAGPGGHAVSGDSQLASREDLAPKPWEFRAGFTAVDPLIVFRRQRHDGAPRCPAHAIRRPRLQHPAAGTRASRRWAWPSLAVRNRWPLTNITAYPGAYSTAIGGPGLQEAGCVRVNLWCSGLARSGDCPAYLDRWALRR